MREPARGRGACSASLGESTSPPYSRQGGPRLPGLHGARTPSRHMCRRDLSICRNSARTRLIAASGLTPSLRSRLCGPVPTGYFSDSIVSREIVEELLIIGSSANLGYSEQFGKAGVPQILVEFA